MTERTSVTEAMALEAPFRTSRLYCALYLHKGNIIQKKLIRAICG